MTIVLSDIKTRTPEEYDRIMSLRKKNKMGPVRLSRLTGLSRHTIHDWLYLQAKPKRLRKTKLLPPQAKQLSPALSYVLGVIESDGCLCKSKRYAIPGENYDYTLTLGVTDRDFADYFSEQVKHRKSLARNPPALARGGARDFRVCSRTTV